MKNLQVFENFILNESTPEESKKIIDTIGPFLVSKKFTPYASKDPKDPYVWILDHSPKEYEVTVKKTEDSVIITVQEEYGATNDVRPPKGFPKRYEDKSFNFDQFKADIGICA